MQSTEEEYSGNLGGKVRNPLSRTMMRYCFLFAAIFALAMGTMSFLVYEQDMLRRYRVYTADALNLVVRTIDGDDLKRCMETGVKSEKYLKLQALANDVKETHKLEFLYIIKPLGENPPDNMMDVMAAYTQAGKDAGTDGLTDLGKYTGDAYPPEVAREYLARMDRNPAVTFFPNDTEFGNIYTAIRPIFDSYGEPIAVICADVLIDEINDGRLRFVEMSTLAGLLAGTLLVALMTFWLNKRVAKPVKLIGSSAASFANRCRGSRDLDVMTFEDPHINTGDELEDLTHTLSAMCQDMRNYTAELIAVDREMGNLKEKMVIMDSIAYKDSLTGVGNKAAFSRSTARLDWDIIGGTADFAMIMVDLNYLKRINDEFGHSCGDQYITNMCKLLKEAAPDEKIFRIGGDEFVIILKREHSGKAEKIIEDIKRRTAILMDSSDLDPWQRVSAATGAAHFQRGRHRSAADVLKEADEAMYRNKEEMHAGRE